ncbi:GNAT family N-acetyltransferase [Lacrimispora saccharolytica]|uniref:GCN5-related N-acetyltransferase n=1 Tax=Lacrimispora saccharolytica (strain ATCC 35040 / DSM 2544 / NRCC 2533 / WM1) TaxID=610130 RepID=D9RAR6_LACSW|nr:GNAT family N-acetyltransferase [Lacrimispora saccharolytica]ADL06113.1 GCN5-related N-acetyltransferase [[Clostridium] saccharolyticum WM1]QRV19772.1 GNAT family N-acetyltransferase [Lacrimispora saccharolytica]
MLLKNPQTRFEEIYPIYKESFPDIERRTKDDQKRVFGNPCYGVRAIEEEGKILAFLGYWNLPSCVFLEHLATAEACRGKGYGKQLVQEVMNETEKPVFLEIEPVTEKDPMTRSRASFYSRLGFHANTFPYEQMPLKPVDRPTPLWIMSYGKPVTEKEFWPYKKEIYELVYGVEIA